MSKEIKRKPSAKSTAKTETASKPVAKPKAKTTAKRKEAPKRPVVFSIPKGGGIWYKLRQHEVIIHDDEKKYNREIRYCPAERSIYKDEQSDVARREQIVFREGALLVNHTMPNLIEYLRKHPDNHANGGRVFIEVNTENDAQAQLDKEFMLHDAIDVIKRSDIEELLPVALSLGIDSSLSSIEIKRALLSHAKSNPKQFMDTLESPFVKIKALVVTACDFNILNPKTDGMYWYDNNSLIIPTPMGQDTKDIFSRFLMTERGIAVREELERQVGSL